MHKTIAKDSTVSIRGRERNIPSLLPPLYLPDAKDIYPYTFRDRRGIGETTYQFHVVQLESDFVSVMICPDLGGRVISFYSKLLKRELFFQPERLQCARIPLNGEWFPWGLEFNFPNGHSPMALMPVPYRITRSQSGDLVTVGNWEDTEGLRWSVTIELPEGYHGFKTRIVLENPGPTDEKFCFWSNAAIEADQDLEFILPASWFDTWYDGVNRFTVPITFESIEQSEELFCLDLQRDDFGVYNNRDRWGVIHKADRGTIPGRKVFTWGCGNEGKAWYRLLGLERAYIEVQTGPFLTQKLRGIIPAGISYRWSEEWLVCGGIEKYLGIENQYMYGLQDGKVVRSRYEEPGCGRWEDAPKDFKPERFTPGMSGAPGEFNEPVVPEGITISSVGNDSYDSPLSPSWLYENHLEEFWQVYEAHPEPARKLAIWYHGRGKTEKAKELIGKLIAEGDPDVRTPLLAKAFGLPLDKISGEVISFVSNADEIRLIEPFRDNPKATLLLDTYFLHREPDKRPSGRADDFISLRNMGLYLWKQKRDWRAALRQFDAAIERQPDCPELYIEREEMLRELGADIKTRRKGFEKAPEAVRSDDRVAARMARIEFDAGCFEACDRILSSVDIAPSESEPTWWSLYHDCKAALAADAFLEGRRKEAQRLLEESIDYPANLHWGHPGRAPESRYWLMKAWMEGIKGRDVLETLRQGAEVTYPMSVLLYTDEAYYKSLCMVGIGMVAEARKFVAQILDYVQQFGTGDLRNPEDTPWLLCLLGHFLGRDDMVARGKEALDNINPHNIRLRALLNHNGPWHVPFELSVP